MDERTLCRRIVEMILSGEISSRERLQKVKLEISREHSLPAVMRNSSILAEATDDERAAVEPLLMKKPVRTLSGVAVVAVMTSPHPCPHGRCAYCPGGTDTPQSYTGKEPAARRGGRNGYDPFMQVSERIGQLEAIGHRTDKVDLVIMGGTFTSRDPDYQEWFVRRCLDAMNGRDSGSLEEAQSVNGSSEHRCIGLTVETRPDVLTKEQIERTMRLGATRVELGVQILDDDVLEAMERGHGTAEVVRAVRDCRDAGLKVCYHIMPGLPGSDPEKDMASFRRMFDSPDHRPDMLKIYTTLVIEGTRLHDMWKAGEYVPYDLRTAVDLLADMKSTVPEYVRIQRIQRDIPAPQIAAGILNSNIRELVAEELRRRGTGCRCIRCREAGRLNISMEDPDGMVTRITEYEASGGKEFFISMEYGDSVAGHVRLRMKDGLASIRELKVFGRMAAIGSEGEWQHRGIGRELMRTAEGIAADNDASEIRVTSGVGVRGYYRSIGYEQKGPYMVKAPDR